MCETESGRRTCAAGPPFTCVPTFSPGVVVWHAHPQLRVAVFCSHVYAVVDAFHLMLPWTLQAPSVRQRAHRRN